MDMYLLNLGELSRFFLKFQYLKKCINIVDMARLAQADLGIILLLYVKDRSL